MSGRPVAANEVQRILALVPWIAAHPGSPKDEIAARFGVTVEQLEADLDLVMMIGVPPYSPAEYIDVFDDGETVTIRLADYFRRPLRLGPHEGLALLAAGRTLLAVPGSDPDGPLATALDKLERALDLPDLAVEVGAPPFVEAVREAAARHERIEIEYWSAGRDEVTTRCIDPQAVFFALGEWYVNAFCHRAHDERLFRVDRIRALGATGEHFEPSDPSPPPADLYNPGPDDPRYTIELPASARWVAETYPTTEVTERPDGGLRVVLVVSETAWLERLLLRVGPGAHASGPEGAEEVSRVAARRVLARYG